MWHDIQSDITKKVHNFASVPKIRRLSVTQKQQLITQMENL